VLRITGAFEMAGYVRGCSREQVRLLSLSDEVSAGSRARVLDAFVEAQDLRALGFSRAAAADAAGAGRPAYDPLGLSKLLTYGYLEGARSSRKLARECHRNVEVKWLLGDARPCFKTIASFRRENGAALVALSRAFARFCRRVELADGEVVAVDGSKFQSAAGDAAVYNEARIARELERVEGRAAAKTAAYLAALESADGADEAADAADAATDAADEARGRAALAELAKLSRRKDKLQRMSDDLKRRGASYCVAGDAEARVLHKRGGAGRVVGYNVQAAVDAKHKFIVHAEVTNAASDHGQLYPAARAAQAVLGADKMTVLADAGYRNATQTRACEAAGIEVVTPAHEVVNPNGKGALFTRDAFEYDAARDCYTCPGGQTLTLRGTDARLRRHYRASASACGSCALKAQCTTASARTVNRHVHADAQERANLRAAERPALMRRRAAVAEHPFANLKRELGGVGRFAMRGLAQVQAEMSLSVLAYNLRRAINIVGAERLCEMLAMPAGPTPASAPSVAPT